MLKDQLIIFLETQIQQSTWLVLRAQEIIIEGDCSDMNAIQPYLPQAEVIAIIPAEDVCLHRLNMPKMSYARLLQAIPYALEDHVIAEVQDLHFAFIVAGEWIEVAIIQQQKMQYWLKVLKDFGLKPQRLISLNMLMPKTKDAWHLFISSSACMLNIGAEHAIVCDLNNTALILEQALQRPSNLPIVLHVYYTSQTLRSHLNFKNINHFEISEHLSAKHDYVRDLCQHLNTTTTINLLQQSFAVKQHKTNLSLKPKRLTYLLGALVGSLFVYPLISWILLATKISDQNQQITRIYQRYFPNATSLIAPKLRMQAKLENIKSDSNQSKVLLMLSKIATSKSTLTDVHLQRFSYADNRLVLEVRVSSVDDVVQFQNALSEQGLNVKQQSATVGDDAVIASLLIA